MNLSIPTLFLFNFFLLQISGTTYTDSLSSFNISSDLYIDQEYKFTPNATELTNYTTAYEKRIFSIEFDEQKFCAVCFLNLFFKFNFLVIDKGVILNIFYFRTLITMCNPLKLLERLIEQIYQVLNSWI